MLEPGQKRTKSISPFTILLSVRRFFVCKGKIIDQS
jgi:hypothetical protein